MSFSADHAFAEALKAFRDGQFDLAEQRCQTILQHMPGSGDAYNILGAIALKGHQAEQAIRYFRLAVQANGDNHLALHNLARALEQTGNEGEAEALFRKACSLSESYKPAFISLAKLYRKQKRYDEAKLLLAQFLERVPDEASASNLLAGILTLQGQDDEALAIFRMTLQVHPGVAELHYNVGNILFSREDDQGAIEAYKRALALNGAYHPARLALGHAYSRSGNTLEARRAYEKTVRLKPDFADAWFSLATTLHYQGDHDRAMRCFEQAIQLDPRHENAWLQSAKTLVDLGMTVEAKQHLARAIEIDPDFEEALYVLAKLLIQDDDLDQALGILQKLQQASGSRAHIYFNEFALLQLRLADWAEYEQNTQRYKAIAQAQPDKLICPPPLSLNYFPIEPEHHLALAKKYSQKITTAASALLGERSFEWKKKAATEKVRIGYISPDFRQHSVGVLLNSAFQYHDRDKAEIYLYHLVSHEDDVTAIFRRNADVFRNLASYSYLKAAEAIHADGIDILIDLAGYTTHSRTAILAMRPAPLQLHFMGYPGGMGAPFIDGVIADQWLAPDADQEHYVEKILRVPNAFFTSPIEVASAAPDRSALGLPRGAFVFCCFNAVYKISPAVFKAWVQILKQVDDGVLWLSDTNATAKQNLLRMAAEAGVAASRLIFASRQPMPDYMASYAAADLFLDTFNYSAGSTAVCALSAGIPVLTLAGRTNASGMGASISAAAGVEETIVHSEGAYVQKAVYYSRNRAELQSLKNRLKARQGLLFDLPASIRHLEAVCIREYRALAF